QIHFRVLNESSQPFQVLMLSDIILITLYESLYKTSLYLNHHFPTRSQTVEQRLRSQLLISYSAIRLFLSIVVSSSFNIVANGLQLPEGGDFEALHCQPSTNFDRSTKLELTTVPPLLGRCC